MNESAVIPEHFYTIFGGCQFTNGLYASLVWIPLLTFQKSIHILTPFFTLHLFFALLHCQGYGIHGFCWLCACVCPKTKIAFGMKPKRASHFTHPSCLLYAVCRDNFQYTLRTLTFKQSSSLMYLNAITFGMHSMLLIVRFSWKIYIRIFFCSLIY